MLFDTNKGPGWIKIGDSQILHSWEVLWFMVNDTCTVEDWAGVHRWFLALHNHSDTLACD